MKFTKREKILISALAILVIGGGFAYLIFMPLLENYQANEFAKVEYSAQKQEMDMVLNRYGNYEQKIDAYNVKIVNNLEHFTTDEYDENVNQGFLNILTNNKVTVLSVNQTGYTDQPINDYIYNTDGEVINYPLKNYVEKLLNIQTESSVIPTIDSVTMHTNYITLTFNATWTQYNNVIDDIIALDKTIYIASSNYTKGEKTNNYTININYYTVEGWK